VVAGGGVADGFGIAALLALGADAVQLGTRFLLTEEATVHDDYKRILLETEVDGTTLVGRGLPIRMIRNAFAAEMAQAETDRLEPEAIESLFRRRSLRQAALEGDVVNGKVEAGQSAGLVQRILPVAELMAQLVAELDTAIAHLSEKGAGQGRRA
jgi:enoyl-[acyl-carrier protein] reductase II